MSPVPPSLHDALRGTPYRVVAPLGQGGMGQVVEAVHIELGKSYAVKLLHPNLTGRPDFEDRMRLEAQTLALLTHPNLVAVHGLGRTPEGRCYLVMERLQGRTLAEELRARGTLPIPEAIEIARQALTGLGAAHAAGIIHRDVKPANLFLCDWEGGRRVVKVLDFGIAKIVGEMREGLGAPAPLSFPTERGVVLGTPRFQAPEQASGDVVDARADVYAMGAVLLRMLVGPGSEGRESMSLGLSLSSVIRRALAIRPEERFSSAAELAQRLERVKGEVTAAPTPARRRETRGALVVLVALVSAAVCITLALVVMDFSHKARDERGAGRAESQATDVLRERTMGGPPGQAGLPSQTPRSAK